MRSGQEYIASLRDGRRIYLDGELIRDVTTHPAFAAPVQTIAGLYDAAKDPARAPQMTCRPPELDGEVNAIWLIPRSREDLDRRRRAHQFWQDLTFGLMGRTPDHVASFLVGFAGAAEVFGRGGAQFADNVRRYYRRAATQDLYLAYTILPPQGDRSKPAHQQRNPHFYAGVVKERDGGIVLRGAQVIGTGAALANEVFLSSIVPLRQGDENYAISVVVPVAAEGLKLFPRRPYTTVGKHVFDYPLSSRFDETDAVVILDDVFMPWENVFIYKNIQLTQAQFFETPAHVLGNFQALIRLSTKLQFLIGLAQRICEAHGTDVLPPVQSQLGCLAAYAAAADAFVTAAGQDAIIDQFGVARPNPGMVNGGLVLQPMIVSGALNLVRELAGGGPLAMPSSAEMLLAGPTADDVREYYQSGHASAEDRVKLLKLAWDLIGTEFGGRQMQYEMFYAGAPFITQARNYAAYDWTRPRRLVEECLAQYGLPRAGDEPPRAGDRPRGGSGAAE